MQRWPTLSNLLLPQNSTHNAHQSSPSTKQQQSDQASTSTFQSTPNDQPSTSAVHPIPSVVIAPTTSSSSRGEGAQAFQDVQCKLDESRSSSRKRSGTSLPHARRHRRHLQARETKAHLANHHPTKTAIRIQNSDESSVSKQNKLKSVVSGASVLPPSPPNPLRYRGKPEKQLTVEETLTKYLTDLIKIVNSGPTGTPLQKQSILSPGGTTRTKMAAFLPPATDTQGSLVTRDARRIRETAEQISEEWYLKKQVAPPNKETQYEIKQMMVTLFMSRLLRPHNHQTQEPACLTRAKNLIPSVEDNYLDSLTIDPRDQFTARHQLGEGDTFAINKKYARPSGGTITNAKR